MIEGDISSDESVDERAAEDAASPLETLRDEAAALLDAECPGALLAAELTHGQLAFRIDAAQIKDVCFALRDGVFAFDLLIDVTAIDWLSTGREPRFEVVYHLASIKNVTRLRLKFDVDGETPEIDSVCDVWPGANWNERETFDLMGIVFIGHPNLQRIMMSDDWEGHPLRKDFPLGGSRSFYYRRDTDEYAGEPDGLVPRIRKLDGHV